MLDAPHTPALAVLRFAKLRTMGKVAVASQHNTRTVAPVRRNTARVSDSAAARSASPIDPDVSMISSTAIFGARSVGSSTPLGARRLGRRQEWCTWPAWSSTARRTAARSTFGHGTTAGAS